MKVLQAAYFTPAAQRITPTIVLFEVYTKIKWERGGEAALLIAGWKGELAFNICLTLK